MSGRPERLVARVLSIAGSDSGGGAGIQADLKAFARCGVHGMTAITAITAQSTVGVRAVHPVPPEIVLAQVRAVAEDIGVDAVKVGMLGTRDLAMAVVRAIDELPAGTPVVVDTVMAAESGSILLEDEALGALVGEVVPRASVITPNLPEARRIAAWADARGKRGMPGSAEAAAGDEDAASDSPGAARDEQAAFEGGEAAGGEIAEAGRRGRAGGGYGMGEGGVGRGGPVAESDEALLRLLAGLGAEAVVLTGGHRDAAAEMLGGVTDLFIEGGADGEVVEIPGERHRSAASHGSGCTHSAALAAQLALGQSPLQAARIARAIAGEAVRDGLTEIGRGAGPVDVLGLTKRGR